MVEAKTDIEVRYYETDLMGIVHHSNYLRYFECARHQFMLGFNLPINKIEQEYKTMMPVVSTECKYKYPAYMGDTLTIVSRVEKMPMAKIEIVSEIYNQTNDLVATGKVVLGFIHTDSRRPIRMPQCMVDIFQPYFNEK